MVQEHTMLLVKLSPKVPSSDLTDFLNYNRKLFTTIDNMNDWFIDAAKDKSTLLRRHLKMKVSVAQYRVYE